MGWDFKESEFSEGLIEAKYSTETGHDLAFSYRYLRDIPRFFESFNESAEENRYEDFEEGLFKINQLTLRGRLALNRSWALTYGIRYSFESAILLTNRFGVEYLSKCRCWAIRLEGGTDRSGGAFFNVQYVLIGLGDDTVRPFSGGGIGSSGRDPLSGAQN
jgi:lipopolysaccharide assembly outer membrane protein LptD (OstA)